MMYTIPEYKSVEVDYIDYEDWNYLETKFSFNKGRNRPNITSRPTKKGTKTIIENTSYAGVIQLKNVRLYLSTKANTKLFYILNFLRSENKKNAEGKKFIHDPDKMIEMEKGSNFLDPMGRLFLNELEKITNLGLCETFVQKRDNTSFLRGKLDIKGQLDNEVHNRFKFSCIFNKLTFNNKLNQIVLKANSSILPLMKYNENVIKDLRYYESSMKDIIDLVDIFEEDFGDINLDELNYYYSDVLKYSKLILNKRFVKSHLKGTSVGFNFMVNMNSACQDLFEAMGKNTVEKYFPELEAMPQQSIRSVVIGSRERPDLILRDRITREIRLIFDFKYKIKDKGSDHRQATMYGLASPGREACCLLLPRTNKNIETIRYFRTDITKPGRNVPIYVRTVDLYMEENLEFDEFVKNIEMQFKNIITDILY